MSVTENADHPSADCWEQIEEAKVLLGSPAGRGDARCLLEDVFSRCQGASAAAARRLLEQLDHEDRLPQRRNAEVEVLRREWAGIAIPQDVRLSGFLDRLRQRPVVLAELSTEVARGLRRWLDRAIEGIQEFLDGLGVAPDETSLGAMEKLARQVTEIPPLETELRLDLVRFRRERFRQLLASLSSEIRSACDEWEIDKAWELIGQLEEADGESGHELQRLEQAAYEADALHTEVAAALERWPSGAPGSWADLRVTLESIAETRRFLDDSRIPRAWHDKVRSHSGALVTGALDFLRRQVDGATTLEELREFWRQFQRLRPASLDAVLQERPEWYGLVLEELRQEISAQVLAADEAAALDLLVERFCSDRNNLPPTASDRLLEWGVQLRRIGANWRLMAQGEEFPPPEELSAGSPFSLPERFTARAPHFQKTLARLRKALDGLEGAEPLDRREVRCEEALEVARRVLAETPNHRRAQALVARAEQQLVHLRLDEALRRLDVETFLGSARLRQAEEPYQHLADAGGALRELACLASLSELTSPDAARWWRTWRSAAASLPSDLPASLEKALQGEEERRREEWLSALDRLLRTHPSPEECQETTGPMAEFLSLPGLAAYHEELTQREAVGRIERLLSAGLWDPAEKELKALTGRVSDFRRLSCELTVGRARAAGPVELAEVLAGGWIDVLATFRSKAYDLLEIALAGVWEQEETAALRRLGEIVRRVARVADLPPEVSGRIEDWLRWLEVEKALEEKIGVSSLRQLALYARGNPSPLLRVRLRRWIERWRRQGKTVALAWAFQAFRDLFDPGEADPVEDLETRGREIAEGVRLDLREAAGPNPPDLASRRRQMKAYESDWRDLDDYLNFVGHKVERPALSPSFQEARALLDSLLHTVETVDRLESTDLRQPKAESDWKSAWLTLKQDLRDLPVADGLLQRLERLHPLTKLTFTELRVAEAAQDCDSPEKLDDLELFAGAARWVRDLIERFERSGQVGGAMWKLVSAEYWQRVPRLAGDLTPSTAGLDLEALSRRFEQMESEEREFRQALRQLDAREPTVSPDGPFFPDLHRPYLELYPRTPPGSRRVFRLFDRFAKVNSRPAILRGGAGHLPAWIADYLNRGVPDVG